MVISIEEARRAKSKAIEAAQSQAEVVGVGLTKIDGSYAVKVNLREAAPASAKLPSTIDGVRVLYEVVGPITRRAATGGR
jgi:hypothetical protein